MVLVDDARLAIDNPVDIICSDTRIELAFSRTLIQASSIIGKTVTIRASGVRDLALNKLASNAEWEFFGDYEFLILFSFDF